MGAKQSVSNDIPAIRQKLMTHSAALVAEISKMSFAEFPYPAFPDYRETRNKIQRISNEINTIIVKNNANLSIINTELIPQMSIALGGIGGYYLESREICLKHLGIISDMTILLIAQENEKIQHLEAEIRSLRVQLYVPPLEKTSYTPYNENFNTKTF